MKPALLDINILIALIDPAHQFHEPAHAWFRRIRRHGWATCPLTENGCVRIMSKPGYPFPGLTAERVRAILGELNRVAGHAFWTDSLSILDNRIFRLGGAGPGNITDIYLLGLANANGGRLATFDQNIALDHVIGCQPGSVEVIAT